MDKYSFSVTDANSVDFSRICREADPGTMVLIVNGGTNGTLASGSADKRGSWLVLARKEFAAQVSRFDNLTIGTTPISGSWERKIRAVYANHGVQFQAWSDIVPTGGPWWQQVTDGWNVYISASDPAAQIGAIVKAIRKRREVTVRVAVRDTVEALRPQKASGGSPEPSIPYTSLTSHSRMYGLRVASGFRTWERGDEPPAGLIASLSCVVGVAAVSLYGFDVTVRKGLAFSWDEVGPQVERVLHKFLLDFEEG